MMSERTRYAPGAPCWVDLGSPDLNASIEFYGGLLGWDVPEAENAEQTGGYRQAMLKGKPVAGLMPLMQEGQPVAWCTYVSVADADVVAGKVSAAGGTMMTEPMDVMNLGRMAIFVDPTGAVFGVWQPGSFIGAEVVNEPGALSWNELSTRDTPAAKEFYGAVFGWTFEDTAMGDLGTYTSIQLGGAPVGGMVDISGRAGDEIPANWLTYFAVEDTDAALQKIEALGGSKAFGPMDSPAGRLAVVGDPAGAMFAVIALSAEALASAP